MSNPKLVVLSYNISFEGMTNNPNGSAGALGAKSTPVTPGSTLTKSAKNIATYIDHIPTKLGRDFDIIGFQESSRWPILVENARSSLKDMCPIGSRPDRSEMASLYNVKKFEYVKHVTGKFLYDRPFHIIVLKYRASADGIIFINVHCPHRNASGITYTFSDMQNELGNAVISMKLHPHQKKYRIVALGDFNEVGWNWGNDDLIPKSFTPFVNDGINTPISVTNTIKTCNHGDGNWSDGKGGIATAQRGGDYIFDSKSPSTIQIPPDYPATELLSDHLPVLALLDE